MPTDTGHALFATVEAMLSRTACAVHIGRPVVAVRVRPRDGDGGVSGSPLSAVEVTDEQGTVSRYVLKRIASQWDWIMRATDDAGGRDVAVWHTGLLDRLPAPLGHAVVAAARDGAGRALLMRDVGAALIGGGPLDPLPRATHERVLDGLAALHVAYWRCADLSDPRHCLCPLPRYYALLAPQRAAAEPVANDELRHVADGWRALPSLVAAEVVALLRRLHADPQPLCDALARFPHTLLHGDYKPANLAVRPGEVPGVVLLDWSLAAAGPPAIDLAWYLGLSALRAPISKEATIAHYAARLAQGLGDAFDPAWWQPQLGVALLGGFLRFGYWLGWLAARHPSTALRSSAQAELAWWSEHARSAARRL